MGKFQSGLEEDLWWQCDCENGKALHLQPHSGSLGPSSTTLNTKATEDIDDWMMCDEDNDEEEMCLFSPLFSDDGDNGPPEDNVNEGVGPPSSGKAGDASSTSILPPVDISPPSQTAKSPWLSSTSLHCKRGVFMEAVVIKGYA